MAYGSEGSQYPDYRPPAPQPSGDDPRRPRGAPNPDPAGYEETYRGRPDPRAPRPRYPEQDSRMGDPRPPVPQGARSRPQPYDPFQTRTREAPEGQRRGYERDPEAYSRAPYEQDRRGEPDRYGADPRAARAGLLDPEETAGMPNQRRGGSAGAGPDGRTGPANRRKGKKIVSASVRRRRRIVRRSLLGVFLVVFGYVGITMYPYISAPGTDTLSARVAEWGRDHHLSWAVTWLENASYKPPPVGGALNAGQLAQLQGPSGPPAPPVAGAADLPPNIVPLAAGNIPGEGVWHPIVSNAAGIPIVEKAVLRPDAVHTSELAYVTWMNHKALKFDLHPGFQQPGGTWQTPDTVGPEQRTGLVATWNGGFKLKPDDALGGFYDEGRTAVPLVSGKAAEVFYQDGSLKIGQWGRDENPGPTVTGVRQNLSLLVDQGQVTVGTGDGSGAMWGLTIKNSYYVARSGVGMTANGDIVYVSGPKLSVYTLAKLLQGAGARFGMELDINPEWVSYMTYAGPDPANPQPTKLWDFVQPADRYYQPSDRDFVAVYTR